MAQNITQWTATGSYSDLSTADITNTAAWTVSDTSIVTVGAANGQVTIQAAGKIWGGDVGVTATLAPGTPGTGTILCISSDSGSVAPRMPQQNNHWVALGLSPWGSWWGLQEASGSDTLVGSGSTPFNLTRADGTSAVAGEGIGVRQGGTFVDWLRVGATLSGCAGQRIFATTGIGPDSGATSVAWLAYGQICQNRTPGAQGFLGWFHVANSGRVSMAGQNVNPSIGAVRLSSFTGGKHLVGPLNEDHADRLHPFLLIYNRTTSEVWGATDICVGMSGNQVSMADGDKGIGNRSSIVTPSSSFVFLACATGALAESLCSHSASADFLSRLGWNVEWKTCPTDSGSIKCPFLDMHYKELGLKSWTATWNMQGSQNTAQNCADRWEMFDTDGWTIAGASTTARNDAAGWKRKAVVISQAVSARLASLCVGQLKWDPTGSMAIIGYISASVGSAANRQIISAVHGTTTAHQLQTFALTLGNTNTTVPVLYCAGATTTGTQPIVDGRYHPLMIVYDKTNSRAKMYTDLEKVTGSFNALALINSVTGNLGFGGRGVFTNPPPMGVLWGAFCTGTLAEEMSDDGKASDFLKRLGWTVSW